MENFHLPQSPKTPEITLDAKVGRLLIAGRSIPENSIEFYKPLYDWLDNYMRQPRSNTVLDVKLEYFNTSSSKCLVEVFRRLEEIKQQGYSVQINWFYEEDDEDMQESGLDFKEIVSIPINMQVMEQE
jgi:SiaC family regulatory phosphoprotein